MKIFKTSKYRFLSNVLKFSLIAVFAFSVLAFSFFVNNSTIVVSAAITSPQITSISPTSGNVGSTVVITGTNFKPVDQVLFGSMDIGTNFKVDSINQISATVPSGFTSGKITVITTIGEAVSSQTFTLDNTVTYNLGKITAKNVTANSVDILFSAEGKPANNIYLIDLKKKTNPTNDTNKVETFKNTNVSASGLATISFAGLISNTDYIATITSHGETSQIDFKTLSKPGDALPPTINALNLTSTSVTINFATSGTTPATPPYIIFISDKNNPNTNYDRNQSKTIESGDITSLGVAAVKFTNLIPNVEYIAELSHNSTSIQKIDFKTPLTASVATITDFSPKEGKVGDLVTISGENLSGVNGVYFNGILAVTSTNIPSEITVKVPEGATEGIITVKIMGTLNPDGTNNDIIASSPGTFKVLAANGQPLPPGTGLPAGTAAGSTTSKAIVWHGLVPECNTGAIDATTGNYSNPCDFNMVMAIINKVINFLLVTMATPLFALIIIYVAWLYLSDMGSSENITKAKKILKNAIIGYVVALAAWLIVKTILTTLGYHGDTYLSLLLINYI